MALFKKKPVAYDLDFSGSCSPAENHGIIGETFSVGIFQWVPKSSGRGIKRSAVIKRIRGFSSEPKKVYDAAELWIKQNYKNYQAPKENKVV
jgi:hypothetical protein